MKRLSTKAIVTIGILIILGGILLLSYNYLAGKKEAAYERVSISLLSEKDGKTEVIVPDDKNVPYIDFITKEVNVSGQ